MRPAAPALRSATRRERLALRPATASSPRRTPEDAMTTVSVFGGTGFLGLRLLRRLAAAGTSVRVAVRDADRARSVLRAAGLQGVAVLRADVRDQVSVAAAVAGTEAVVNAVSAYVEK